MTSADTLTLDQGATRGRLSEHGRAGQFPRGLHRSAQLVRPQTRRGRPRNTGSHRAASGLWIESNDINFRFELQSPGTSSGSEADHVADLIADAGFVTTDHAEQDAYTITLTFTGAGLTDASRLALLGKAADLAAA